MDILFEKDYLAELYYQGKTTNKKYRFQPDVVKRYRLRIDTLANAASIDELFPIHSLHYEVLKGDKEGISSIRVNNQYRIEFKVSVEITDTTTETTVTICNILALSNHYK
jgi:proteic killer suppression protein